MVAARPACSRRTAAMPQTTLLSYFAGSGVSATPQYSRPPTQNNLELPSIVRILKANTSEAALEEVGSGVSEPSTAQLSPSGVDQAFHDNFKNACVEDVSGIAIVPIQHSHLPAIQRLTSTLLPVKYPDKFFADVANEVIPATFSRVALLDSKPVGWIRCRLDPFPEKTSPLSSMKPIYNQVYIQALCLLAPYRGQGVAKKLLETVLGPSVLTEHDVECVYAHVWESNEDALEWYQKRGFHRVTLVENYYRKLRPGGAWIVRRNLR